MPAVANANPDAPIKPSLTIKRRLNAPPEAVYAAWTDPKKLVHWFGPDQGPVTKAETDVRVGGRFHVVFHTEDGEEQDVSGIYREVVRTRSCSSPGRGGPCRNASRWSPSWSSRTASGSLLTLIHEQFFDEPARDRHE